MKTILKLKHANKEDLFFVVNGNVAKAYDVAETYKNKFKGIGRTIFNTK